MQANLEIAEVINLATQIAFEDHVQGVLQV